MIADLTEIRAVDGADVYKGDVHAGRLRRMGDHVEFSYDGSYRRDGGPAVASTLPVRNEPYITAGGAVPAFFAGLLPEGARLHAIVQGAKISADDEMSMLLAVAGDAVGDVTVVPVGERPRDPGESTGVQDPGAVSFADMFRRSISTVDPQFDTALPGVQDKLSDSLISFPVAAGGGPAILKLSPRRYPRLVENEAFFLGMAASCGFRVPPFRIVHDRRGVSGLLVERFDRVVRSGGVGRIAQEDACQLSGRWPADKYRLSMRSVVGRVASLVSAPAAAVLELVRLTAFSYLIVNGDMHAKNISVRWLPSERIVELTPVYDLVSTRPYPLDHLLALHVDGRRNRIRGGDLVRFAESFGIPPRLTRRKLLEICDRATSWIDRVGEIGFDPGTTGKLQQDMVARAEELR